jgi:hypothetical protein
MGLGIRVPFTMIKWYGVTQVLLKVISKPKILFFTNITHEGEKNKKKTYYLVLKNPSCISKQYSTLFTLNSQDAHDKAPNAWGMTEPLFLGSLRFECPSL